MSSLSPDGCEFTRFRLACFSLESGSLITRLTIGTLLRPTTYVRG